MRTLVGRFAMFITTGHLEEAFPVRSVVFIASSILKKILYISA